MGINTDLSRVQYDGNGATTGFAFGNRVTAASQLAATRTVIATGVETPLILNDGGADGFSVAGVPGDAVTVNTVTAPAIGTRITIYYNMPLTQTADYVPNDPFPAETHEGALDKLTIIAQQLKEAITRSLKFPVFDTNAAELDSAVARANKIIGFDANGDIYYYLPTSPVAGYKQSIFIPARLMTPAGPQPCAAFAAVNSASSFNPDLQSLDFDPSTTEYAQFDFQLPNNWDKGALQLQLYWSHPATTVNFGVVWSFTCAAFSNNDSMTGSAMSGLILAADTGGVTSNMYVTDLSSGFLVSNFPSDNDMISFKIARQASNGSDTLAVDARLHGAKLFYGITDLDQQ